MNKKVIAIAIATLMLAGLVPALQIPVANAQPGVTSNTCFLRPGQNDLLHGGVQSPFCVFMHPGVNDTFRHGWSHTLGTLWGNDFAPGNVPGNPGRPDNNPQTRQVFDRFLDYSVLASSSDSIGDIQFDFLIPDNEAAAPMGHQITVTRIDIYVPPEFVFTRASLAESVWTDITNDYQFIWVTTRNAYDPIAPGWTRITIGQDAWWAGRMNMTAGIWHVRLMGLKAPTTSGLYHFKIYAAWRDNTAAAAAVAYRSIGVMNYPVLGVKGELNPAWVEVVVRTHAFNAPPYVSGKVVADGATPEGRSVQAWGFWSVNDWIGNSATPGATGGQYRLYLFGLAEGTYTLKAEASGFNPTTTDRFTVLAGQSHHLTIVLLNSPRVHITMWSKHGTGAIPWHNLWQLPYGTNNPAAPPVNGRLGWFGTPAVRDVLLNLYDADGNFIGYWASDTEHGVTSATPWPAGFGGGNQKELAPPNMLLGLHDDNNPTIVGGAGGTIPSQTAYQAWLVDNVDPTWAWANGAGGFPRGYPSTHWDGHVPWTWADYVAGMPNGAYEVQAFVTGYIMDEADAYQRQFVLAGMSIEQVFDLRRSNWIETTLHLPPSSILGGWTTVTLVAEDANNNERGALAFTATPAMLALNWTISGVDVTAGAYGGGLILEGWNAIFPNYGWPAGAPGLARRAQYKDYGLNPTPSTHSPDTGAVETGPVELAGNPYTMRLYMSDMGRPWHRVNGTGWYNIVGGDPQTSVFLCNSPTPLSFSIINASLWISLRSTDFEVPAHSRPWTFPGSEIWVDFVNEAGESAAILDPTLYGLIQDPGTWNVSLGWVIPGTNPATPRNPLAPFNHPRGVSPFDIDYINPAGRHEHVGVHFYGCDFAAPVAWQWAVPLEYTLMPAFRSTRLPAGQYSYNAYTHGYVQRRNFPVMVPPAGWADIEADLIQGGQIRVWMEFRHEAQATRFNGFVRVEAFDSNDNFVGASIYGQAQPNFYTLLNTAPAGGLGGTGGYLNYTWLGDHKKWRGAAQGADFGLWNATSLEAMNIFPSSTGDADSPGYPFNTCGAGPGGSGLVGNWACPITGQRAFTSSYMYASRNVPLGIGRPIPQDRGINYFVLPWWTQNINANNTWAGWPGWHAVSGLPAAVMPAGQTVNLRGTHQAAANRLEVPLGGVEVFDVYGFYWYWGDRAVTWAGGWPTTNGWDTAGFAGRGSNYWAGNAQWDHGLAGSVNVPGWEGSGAGTYTIKVWAFDARGPNNASERVPWSDDWRMYQMGWEVSGLQVPWGGAAEVWITMNAMATLRGTIRWFDMFGNLRPLPWAMISATNPDTVAYSSGYGAVQTGVSDSAGSFIMWLPEGEHDVSVSTSEAPQAWSSAPPTANAYYKVVVTDGWVGGGDTQLSGSGTPIPELPSFVVPLGLFAALAASAWLLRKRNLNLPVLMN